MKNKLFLIIFIVSVLFSSNFICKPVSAEDFSNEVETYKAKVLNILQESEIVRENGAKVKQQNIEVEILEGPLMGQKVVHTGISELDVISSDNYNIGDKVFLSQSKDSEGNSIFYVSGYVRSASLGWLLVFFIFVVLVIGGNKGFWALVSLTASFFLIMKVLVPLVFLGYDPLVVGIIISFLVLLLLVYLTEGWNRKSHISIISIALALLATALLAQIFGSWSRLSGTAQEEVTFLIFSAKEAINFHNLLLAAIIIGTLGVLDDIVIAQVEAVSQIREANSKLPNKKVFEMATKIGQAHLGAIINTLFLAYVGASLPLILLFNLNQEPFLSFSQVINNEEIATEIVRTLVGVIGLCLAAPIATAMAVKYGQSKKIKG